MKKKVKPVVNMGKIKRDLMDRDMGLDSRFTTKVVKSKKEYKRKNNKFDDNE